jgi:hypothetical protein
MPTIHQATRSYENWMRRCTSVVEAQLRSKHEQMRKSLFLFFRGTFYRWAQTWPEICPDLSDAPKVLAVGDLHVGSFGTWRDSEGRLCWGVDDFDDSYPLPYTNDLVRLTASLKIAIDAEHLTTGFKEGCRAILEGYQDTLKNGGSPLVLAEHEKNLEQLGVEAFERPDGFWEKLDHLPVAHRGLPRDVKTVLRKSIPMPSLDYKVVRRQAGMGSLGQQRYVAIATWQGGRIAREAKAVLPSACVWLEGRIGTRQPYSEKAIRSAVRSHDPFQNIVGTWLIRRLSPDSNPIEITDLPEERDEETLLYAMGVETANVHLGSKRQVANILRNLRSRKSNWLRSAGKDMADAMEADWKTYKDA